MYNIADFEEKNKNKNKNISVGLGGLIGGSLSSLDFEKELKKKSDNIDHDELYSEYQKKVPINKTIGRLQTGFGGGLLGALGGQLAYSGGKLITDKMKNN